jgi:hypothetical protein
MSELMGAVRRWLSGFAAGSSPAIYRDDDPDDYDGRPVSATKKYVHDNEE